MEFLKNKDLKNYTVQELRSQVRGLIKETNKIIYDLNASEKSDYMRAIAKDMAESTHINVNQSGELFTQTNVKYLRKVQLKTLYNELAAFINADKESIEYAKKLAGRKETMRQKTSEALGRELNASEYQTMLDLWDEYGETVEQYGYRELADLIRSKDDGKKAKDIVTELSEVEKILSDEGIPLTKGNVLTYTANRELIEGILKANPGITISEAIERISTQ